MYIQSRSQSAYIWRDSRKSDANSSKRFTLQGCKEALAALVKTSEKQCNKYFHTCDLNPAAI